MTAQADAEANNAYTKGLCIDCHTTPHSASRLRCNQCHQKHQKAMR